jgi:hypothetical protein
MLRWQKLPDFQIAYFGSMPDGSFPAITRAQLGTKGTISTLPMQRWKPPSRASHKMLAPDILFESLPLRGAQIQDIRARLPTLELEVAMARSERS